MYKLQKKVKHCKEKLLEWRKKEVTNTKVQIKNIKRNMTQMQEEKGGGGIEIGKSGRILETS